MSWVKLLERYTPHWWTRKLNYKAMWSSKNVLIFAIMKIVRWFSLVELLLFGEKKELSFERCFHVRFYKLIKTSSSSLILLHLYACLLNNIFLSVLLTSTLLSLYDVFLSISFSLSLSFPLNNIDTEARDLEVKHYTSTSSSVFTSWRLIMLLLNLNFSLFVIHYTRFNFN